MKKRYVVGVIVLCILAGVGMYFGTQKRVDDAVRQDQVPITVQPTSQAPKPKADLPRDKYPSVVEKDKMVKVANDFAHSIITDKGAQGYPGRVSSLVTPQFLESMKSVDPQSVPTGELISTPRNPELVEFGQNYGVFQAKFMVNRGQVMVIRFRVIQFDGGWKVDTYQPESLDNRDSDWNR